MKNILKIEEFAMFLGSIYLFSLLPFSWWWFLVLILAPDIGMLGYLANPRIGAWLYNVFHHKGIVIGIYALGMYAQNPIVQLIGVILFAHASMDRMVGYGLKFEDNFKHTHLGEITN